MQTNRGVVSLKRLGDIELPAHTGPGGFDHAAVMQGAERLYVAHTANDAVDVIDTRAQRFKRSVLGLKGVAGVLVDEAGARVFTSNRGEDTAGVFSAGTVEDVRKLAAGSRPNGLAFDPGRDLLLCANVGMPETPASWTVSVLDLAKAAMLAAIPLPGRPRWAVYDPDRDRFFVNIAEPACIVAIDPGRPAALAGSFGVPARGPHGLDLDRARGRLYCACDDGQLVALDTRTGEVTGVLGLSGAPDVVFLSASLGRLYVAIGDPGCVDVIDVEAWERVAVIPTERGAHTIAWDEAAQRLYAFLPLSHSAAVFQDRAGPA